MHCDGLIEEKKKTDKFTGEHFPFRHGIPWESIAWIFISGVLSHQLNHCALEKMLSHSSFGSLCHRSVTLVEGEGIILNLIATRRRDFFEKPA